MEKIDKDGASGQEKSHEEKLVHDLITVTDKTDLTSLQIRGRLLDFDFSKPLAAIIVDWTQPQPKKGEEQKKQGLPQNKEALLELLHSFFESSTCLTATFGSTKSIVLKTMQMTDVPIIVLKKRGPLQENHHIENLREIGNVLHQHIHKELNLDVSIGLGNYYEGDFSAKKSFREAILALGLGKNLEKGKRVFHVTNYSLINLFLAIQRPQRKDFLWNTLKPLQKEDELIRTLEVFFEANMNTSLAAKKLFAHRNTLIYRLNKIENLTGLNPRNFYDATRLYVALKLYYLETQALMD